MIWWVRATFGLAIGALLILAAQAYLRPSAESAPIAAGPGPAPAAPMAVSASPAGVAAPRPTSTPPALVSRMARTTPTALPLPTVAEDGVLAVSISDSGFVPAELRAQVGRRVAWRNEGQQGHDVTVFGESTGHWDSGLLGPGGTFQRAFAAPGQYDYVCSLHAMMRGRVVVEP